MTGTHLTRTQWSFHDVHKLLDLWRSKFQYPTKKITSHIWTKYGQENKTGQLFSLECRAAGNIPEGSVLPFQRQQVTTMQSLHILFWYHSTEIKWDTLTIQLHSRPASHRFLLAPKGQVTLVRELQFCTSHMISHSQTLPEHENHKEGTIILFLVSWGHKYTLRFFSKGKCLVKTSDVQRPYQLPLKPLGFFDHASPMLLGFYSPQAFEKYKWVKPAFTDHPYCFRQANKIKSLEAVR